MSLNLAALVLRYESSLDSQDGPDHDLDDQLPEVIVPGRLWEAWLRQARIEVPAEPTQEIAKLGRVMPAIRSFADDVAELGSRTQRTIATAKPKAKAKAKRGSR